MITHRPFFFLRSDEYVFFSCFEVLARPKIPESEKFFFKNKVR